MAFAAEPRAERLSAQGGSACSMPLAELFVPWALAAAVTDTARVAVRAVISVVDCAPAAAVLSAATSRGAQMRSLVCAARRDFHQWLAAAVPRELNTDADILSHPSRWAEVSAAAASTGLTVVRVRTPERCWQALRAAIALPMGREAAGWREAGELSVASTTSVRLARRHSTMCRGRGP